MYPASARTAPCAAARRGGGHLSSPWRKSRRHSTHYASPHPTALTTRAGAPPALRCSFLEYCPIFSVVAPCPRGASSVSVLAMTSTTGCYGASGGNCQTDACPTTAIGRAPRSASHCQTSAARSGGQHIAVHHCVARWRERAPGHLGVGPRRAQGCGLRPIGGREQAAVAVFQASAGASVQSTCSAARRRARRRAAPPPRRCRRRRAAAIDRGHRSGRRQVGGDLAQGPVPTGTSRGSGTPQ